MRFGTSRNQLRQVAVGGLLLGVGIAAGWALKGMQVVSQPVSDTSQKSLRLAGFNYVSPLLVCDTNLGSVSPQLEVLRRDLNSVIATSKENSVISEAALYFRDLATGKEIVINGNEKFFPASLKKIPLMMKVYHDAEKNQTSLAEKRILTANQDYNAGVAIPPEKAPIPGNAYSREELIEYMIKYSDNISFQVLLATLGNDKFNQIFTDLQLFYPDNLVAIDDYITPFQFSLFFRTLYNATYLSAAQSEKALKLLSETEFNDGLVAGVPKDIPISHKFGVGVVNQQDGVAKGELHDCGITYHPNNPYLLCVMTKSEASILKVSGVIASLSRTAYKAADENYR